MMTGGTPILGNLHIKSYKSQDYEQMSWNLWDILVSKTVSEWELSLLFALNLITVNSADG